MKAVQFSEYGGPEVLEIVDVPDPHPGPGQIRVAVRAVGINPIDYKMRAGLMPGDLPQMTGREVAGVVDEVGEGVTDAAPGDKVFGFAAGAAAELALAKDYAPIPPSLQFTGAAALPVAVETATRTLDLLAVGDATTVLINGAAGGVGSAAVQIARNRGARVIGTASPNNHDYLRSLGAEPTTYGDGLVERVRAIAPDGVDAALDAAGGGSLPALVELAGGARSRRHDRRLPGRTGHGGDVQRRHGRVARTARAHRHRRADRGRPLLAAGLEDLPACPDRRCAPGKRGRARARQARAARRMSAQLAALDVADPPERWRALGFTVDADERVALGGVVVAARRDGRGNHRLDADGGRRRRRRDRRPADDRDLAAGQSRHRTTTTARSGSTTS